MKKRLSDAVRTVIRPHGTYASNKSMLAIVKKDALGVVWQTIPTIEEEREARQELNLFTIGNDGLITPDNFEEIRVILQQICCLYDETKKTKNLRFKNNVAKSFMEKYKKRKKNSRRIKKIDLNYVLPNIISSVASIHPLLNFNNIWDLTIFQLYDIFYRIKSDKDYQIESTHVSVWGDEKNIFDSTLWHRNNYDKERENAK